MFPASKWDGNMF